MPDTTETTEQQLPAFTPDDLLGAVGLIDEAVNQGAYKGWEAVQAAATARSRLLMFAQHWQNTINAASEDALASAAEAAKAAPVEPTEPTEEKN